MNAHASPFPLGATLNDHGCNFAVHAPNIRNLKLVLFGKNGLRRSLPFKRDYSGVQYMFVNGIESGQEYGFSLEFEGENYLVSDPYAKAISQPLNYQQPYSAIKSWRMAKSVVRDNAFDWQGAQPPRIPREKTILFETHVKGLTKLHPNVTREEQGTYLGLVSDAMLNYYKQQNINAIQLLPVAACMHEPHLLEMKKVNYWGYNPYLFMAPDPRYAKHDAVTEFKTAVRELHKNGIEVILDVVYNHTAEGGEGGPVFNLKALDPRYYLKQGQYHMNYTGCGNTVNLDYQASLNLVMDTLRYWVTEYQIDGFRFDLAATLGRNGDNFNTRAAFFRAVEQDPILKTVKLIAEPWDIGPNGYQVGAFPDGWNECNDKFRDITRSFWRGDNGYLKKFATRLMGSRDIYSASRWPQKMTVNYITYHDGYTLQDLVSYKDKHNEANGEDNRDGHGDNRSDNYGEEGPTKNTAIIALREKQKRNFLTSLLFSFSIPHILTADAVSHSQNGNNNAYCQDNEISWLNWEETEDKQEFSTWLSDMITARQKHMVPFIEAFSGKTRNDNRVHWYRPDSKPMEIGDWDNLKSVGLYLGIGHDGDELLYLINQASSPARFKLPKEYKSWRLIVNTANSVVGEGALGKESLLEPMSMMILKRSGSYNRIQHN